MISEDISLDLYLLSKKLSRSHFYILKYYVEEIQDQLPVKCKFINELEKYGYLYQGEISAAGLDLYSRILTWEDVYVPGEKKKKEKKEYSVDFLEWLQYYPQNDIFDGFLGNRDFHKNLDACDRLYKNIIKLVPHQEMIRALQTEVKWRKDQSKIKGANQLSFQSNTHNYLKDKKFEKFLGKSIVQEQGRVQNTKIAF